MGSGQCPQSSLRSWQRQRVSVAIGRAASRAPAAERCVPHRVALCARQQWKQSNKTAPSPPQCLKVGFRYFALENVLENQNGRLLIDPKYPPVCNPELSALLCQKVQARHSIDHFLVEAQQRAGNLWQFLRCGTAKSLVWVCGKPRGKLKLLVGPRHCHVSEHRRVRNSGCCPGK